MDWRTIVVLKSDRPGRLVPAVRIACRQVEGRDIYSHTLGVVNVEGIFQVRTHIVDRETEAYGDLLDQASVHVRKLRSVQTSAPEVSRRRVTISRPE